MPALNRKQKAEHQFAKAQFKGVPKRSTPGPAPDAAHTVMFTVSFRNGAWNTNRVRGQSASSTCSRMDAANRLAGKLAGDARSVLEQVGENDFKGIYTFRLHVNPRTDGEDGEGTDGQTPPSQPDGQTPPSQPDGQTPPSELDGAGGGS